MGLLELSIGLYFGSVLLFTYILLGLATRQINKRKLEVPELDEWPSLSILVPTYNEQKHIHLLLRRLRDFRTRYPGNVEFRIADDLICTLRQTNQFGSAFPIMPCSSNDLKTAVVRQQ